MKKLLLVLAFTAMSAYCAFADVVISGHVRSYLSRNAIIDAEVRVPGTNVSVIANEDGFFSLKLDYMPSSMVVSAVGHRNRTLNEAEISANPGKLEIWLIPETRFLDQVTVYSPDYIVETAIRNIPYNYAPQSEVLSCFYRETTRKSNRYVTVREAVFDVYKSDYSHGISRDKVQVHKGRSLASRRNIDTVAIKVLGGPYEAVLVDIVKNREILFYPEDIPAYNFTMAEGTSIDDRPQYVIHFQPKDTRPYALYHGTMYIDMELLAFTRVEFSLEMDDQVKATSAMLQKKPVGLRFRPRELTTVISYHYDGNCFRLNYLRNYYSFSCDYKKRLFYATCRVVSEMVVTDYHASEIPNLRKEAFNRYDFLDNQTADFNDSAFWADYNILEPSESLEHAIGRLKKIAR